MKMFQQYVIPRLDRGIQAKSKTGNWIPASAGMTENTDIRFFNESIILGF